LPQGAGGLFLGSDAAEVGSTLHFMELPKIAHVVLPLQSGQQAMEKIRILFVSANPTGTVPLKLDDEVREIEAKIRAAEHRDSLELITKWAARPDDLLQALNQHRPHVVHFSGHGSPTDEIILIDQHGAPKPVSQEALVYLFRTLKDNIRVVLLNACYSRSQAEAITGVIDCAIGMRRAIGDRAAIAFAASFYRAVGFGRSVQAAFEQGKTALLLEGIREEQTPDLLTAKAVNAESIVLVNPS
jgi:CHAT domain